MASLADLPELVGFFSYSRKDDLDSEGALSRLRSRIQSELRLQLGRDYRLWQDTAAIPEGALWEDEIQRAISESVFFIPIITPSSIASGHCRREFESFRDRERALGRNDLIFPILYVTVKQLESEEAWRQDALLNLIGQRQYFDYRPLRRFRDLTPEVSFKIEVFCSNICNALHRPARTNPGLAATADQQVSANLAPSAPTAAAGQMAAPAAPPLDAPPAARDYAARRDAVDVKTEQVQQPPPPPPLPSSANRQIKRGQARATLRDMALVGLFFVVVAAGCCLVLAAVGGYAENDYGGATLALVVGLAMGGAGFFYLRRAWCAMWSGRAFQARR